jgi:diphthamide biosynthesis enzyme Dph1/Dph2-like protein
MAELMPMSFDGGPPDPRQRKQDIPAEFKILETVEWIIRHGFAIVGLQFPDDLLPVSVPVFRLLRSKLNANEIELYIMADTTYGSCCVDHVAAQHVNAQAVVHYGEACLSMSVFDFIFFSFKTARQRWYGLTDSCLSIQYSFLAGVLCPAKIPNF